MSEEIEIDLVKSGGKLLGTPGFNAYTADPIEPIRKKPQAAKSEPVEKKVEQAVESSNTCKHCGQDPTTEPVLIDPSDVVDYQRSVWCGQKFVKTYTLFGEAASVSFRDMTVKQRQAIKTKLMAEAAQFANNIGGAILAYERANLYCLALSIAELRLGEAKTEFAPTDDVQAAVDRFSDVCSSDLVYQTVWNTFMRFQDLRDAIVKKATDPSFYGAVKPAGQ